jgi:hypothetical protein
MTTWLKFTDACILPQRSRPQCSAQYNSAIIVSVNASLRNFHQLYGSAAGAMRAQASLSLSVPPGGLCFYF